MNIIVLFWNFFKKIPFYPFWLENIKSKDMQNIYINFVNGDCLEVGAGNTDIKNSILLKNKNVKTYIASDYIKTHNNSGNKNNKIDDDANALNLKYQNMTFDTYLSFEVLEHLPDTNKCFSEASRILKTGGHMIFTVPFLYREHGSSEFHEDYFRFTRNSFYVLANKFGFEVINIFSNTGIGTTVSVLINTFFIRKIYESNFVFKILFFIFSPLIFLLTNIIGYFFDLYPDNRYALRNLVILKKI